MDDAISLAKADPVRFLALVFSDWFVIAASLALARYINHPVGYWICVLIVGNRQHGIGVMLHDASHFTFSRNRRLNDLMGNLLAAWPLLVDVRTFRATHFAHHRSVGTPADTELIYRKQGAPDWDLPKTRKGIYLDTLKDLCGRNCINYLYLYRLVGPSTFRQMLPPLVFLAAIWSFVVYQGGLWIMAIWYSAMLTSFLACFRWRTWFEHLGFTGTHRVTLNWWQRLLIAPHGAHCHYEHHLWPGIPCWNLPRARSLDTSEKIITLSELFDAYEKVKPLPSDHYGRESLLRSEH